MSHSYTLSNENAAKIGGTGRINETGAYEGQFTRAEAITSKNGTTGIEFDFRSKDGSTASFLQVWTKKSNGENLSGLAVIDALMLLMRVGSMEPSNRTVEKWDKNTKTVSKQNAHCFVDLMGKNIGLVLQKEYSEYNGEKRSKMLIYAAYDIASRKTPKEIVNKSNMATSLDSMLSTIKDKTEKISNARSIPAIANGYQEMDDDIPF